MSCVSCEFAGGTRVPLAMERREGTGVKKNQDPGLPDPQGSAVKPNPGRNLIVGASESGKSTLAEDTERGQRLR